jgi:hypothetical protein
VSAGAICQPDALVMEAVAGDGQLRVGRKPNAGAGVTNTGATLHAGTPGSPAIELLGLLRQRPHLVQRRLRRGRAAADVTR